MRTAFTSAGLMSSGLSRNGSAGVRQARIMGRGFIRCVMRRRCNLANNSRRHLTRRYATDSLRNRSRRNIQDGGIPNDFSSWTAFGSFGIGSEVLITFALPLLGRGGFAILCIVEHRKSDLKKSANRAQIRKDDGHGGPRETSDRGNPDVPRECGENIRRASSRMFNRTSGCSVLGDNGCSTELKRKGG